MKNATKTARNKVGGNTIMSTNCSKNGTARLHELVIKTDKKSKFTNCNWSVKSKNSLGHGTVSYTPAVYLNKAKKKSKEKEKEMHA